MKDTNFSLRNVISTGALFNTVLQGLGRLDITSALKNSESPVITIESAGSELSFLHCGIVLAADGKCHLFAKK